MRCNQNMSGSRKVSMTRTAETDNFRVLLRRKFRDFGRRFDFLVEGRALFDVEKNKWKVAEANVSIRATLGDIQSGKKDLVGTRWPLDGV